MRRLAWRLLAPLLLLALPFWAGDACAQSSPATERNWPAAIWQDHRELLVAALGVFLAQALTIAGLLIHRRRSIALEKLLLESEEQAHTRLRAALEHKRQYEAGLELLLALNQRAGKLSERQICDQALDIAVETTKSDIGYLHYLNEDQNTIAMGIWNAAALRHCTAAHQSHYPLDQAGIWADSARTRAPVIHNDYPNMPEKKSRPDHHAHLKRHMSVPVVDGDKVRMIIGVGNKAADYAEEDARQLQLIANEVQKIVMRRRTEQALHESEARFRFITDLSPGLVWVADASRRCTWFNKTWLDFTGRGMVLELGDGWAEGVHADDVGPCLASYTRHFDAREPFVMEFRLRRHDGEYRWMLDIGQPRCDEAGEFKGYVGTCLDITARKAAEDELNKLWLAVEQTPHSIVITDLAARIEYVNQAFCKVSGYTAAEALGQNPRLLQSGQTPASAYAEMWAALGRGNIWQGEFTNRRKNGETYVESVRISPVRQPDGRITHYLAIKEDITEQKRAETAIRESKLLLQRVIDSTPDWVFVKDRQHRFMLVNEPFAKALNQTPENMIGRPDSDFVPAEGLTGDPEQGIRNVHADDDAVFAGQSIHDPCDRTYFGAGEPRVFDTFKGPLRDSAQNIYGVLCYRRDITERFNTERGQQVLEKQLRQAQKMELIGHLTGGIAHDFNNILASMFGYAELVQMSPTVQDNPQLSLYLQEILQAGIRAKELVAQLLTFSHRREAATEPIIVAPIVREVAKLLRSTMPSSISIGTDIAAGLPEVLISPVQLHQVLMNLGVNARDAIAGQGTVAIAAAAVTLDSAATCASCHQPFAGSYLMLAVSDTGQGIAPEHLPKIFDPFFTTKEVGRGSGLGLSVLHGIVHSANGHIGLDSVPGAGSEFRIYLPAHAAHARRVMRESRPEIDTLAVHGHVLVVDDEEAIVGFVTALLENFGCRVTGTTSATAALRLFEDDPDGIDLVITDQTMPELTGADLARAMLRRRPDLPIVLATGYSNAIDEETARRIGIRRFLVKPVPAQVFADMVAEYLAAKTRGQ